MRYFTSLTEGLLVVFAVGMLVVTCVQSVREGDRQLEELHQKNLHQKELDDMENMPRLNLGAMEAQMKLARAIDPTED